MKHKNLIRFAMVTLFTLIGFSSFANKTDTFGVISCANKEGNVIEVKAEMAEYMILLVQNKATSTEYIILGSQDVLFKTCRFVPNK